MTRREDHTTELVALLPRGEAAIRAYLSAHSGLPGPRGNLELAEAWGDVGPEPAIRVLAGDDDEYLRFCGVVGLGRLLAESLDDDADAERTAELTSALHTHATDASWRVREATAMALQRVGDRHPAALRTLVGRWAADPHPLVQRAAVAGVCEPRLLDTATAAAALEACATATRGLAARPSADRRDPDVRTLRQALGYCWSVAVAAGPGRGLPMFRALEGDHASDADVAWIVRENLRKKRLVRVLDQEQATGGS